jgi:hypothetical protein
LESILLLVGVQPHSMGDQPAALSKTSYNQMPIFRILSRVAKLVHEWTLDKEEHRLEDLRWRRRQGAFGAMSSRRSSSAAPFPRLPSTLREKRRCLLWRSTWSPPRRSTPRRRARGRVQEATVRAPRCLHTSPPGETSGGARLDAPIPSAAGALRVGLSTPRRRARGRVQEAAVRAPRCLHASPPGETSGGARLDAPIPSAAGALRVGLAVDDKVSVVAGLHLAPFPLSRR